MAGSRTLKLSILGDVDNLNKSLKAATADVETFGDKVSKAGKVVGAALVAAAAAAGAYAIKIGVDGVKAAIEDIVRRDLDKGKAALRGGAGQYGRPVGVGRPGLGGMGFSSVHRGPGSGVDDRGPGPVSHPAAHRPGVGQVQFGTWRGHDLKAGRRSLAQGEPHLA
jgi:hypothetical protein